MYSLPVIQEIAANEVAIITALSGGSAVLIRTMYDDINRRYMWRGEDGSAVTDAEWDTIEAMIAALYSELEVPYECPSSGSGIMLPVGSIFASATALTPAGCVKADGSVLIAEDYPELAIAIDPQYLAVVDDVPVIILPNIKGRVVAGAGNALPQGTEFGSYTHTLTVAELPSHNHLQRYHSNTSGSLTGHVADVTSSAPVNEMVATANTGGDTPFDISQPSIAFWYYIVAQTI